jgi:hypothetical protein
VSEQLVSTQTALEQLRRADERWRAAMRGLESYPRRLRELADAAEHEGRALTLSHLANVKWRPMAGASQLRRPLELERESERAGPAAMWTRFDRAWKQLGTAMEADSITELAAAFQDLSTVASELAASLEQPRVVDEAARRRTG